MKGEEETVANCSKQLGQRKKNIFHQNVEYVYTTGDKGSGIGCGRMVIVLLECKVEEDRSDTEGNVPEIEFKQIADI